MPNRSASAPVLQRFSPYLAAPKYSIQGKWHGKGRKVDEIPAANKYDVRELVTNTSKFRSISRACGFSKAYRWKSYGESVTKGPGQYDTAKSTIRKQDISFGKSTRPEICGKPTNGPGPGQYETRGRNNTSEPTLSEVTCKFAGRTGWFYDNAEATRKPGPGQYTLGYAQVELPVGIEGPKIGTSLRPTIESHLGVNSKAPSVGPGHYAHLTTLGGAKVTPYNSSAAYSFTSASCLKKTKPRDDPEFILQVTQFPQGGFNN